MAKNAYFGTDTGNFGTGTAMYASHNIKQKEVSAGVIEKSPRNDQLAASQS